MNERSSRPLPQSPAAEASLLGALLLEPHRLAEVRDRIRDEDFSKEAHRLIYAAVRDLVDAGSEPSFQAVTQLLESRGALQSVGGAAAVVALIEATPAAAHVGGYAAVVERASTLRRLIGAAQEMVRLAFLATDPKEALGRAQELLFAVSEKRLHREVVSVGQALRDLFESRLGAEREAAVAIPTGFATLDRLLGAGLHRGELVIVAARPSLGKTSFALNVLRNAALHHDAKVALFSLEMSETDLTLRLISGLADIDGGRLRRGALDVEELQAISHASAQLMRRGIYIEECTRLSVTDVMTHARKLQAREGLDLVVVDYLQLMEAAGGENRVQEIAQITRGLKETARELNVPVVLLSQLNRQIESRTGGEPKLSDIRECVTGDTRLIDADSGRWVAVRELKPGAAILSLDRDQKIRAFTLEDVWATGRKPIFEVTSQAGRVIRATSNHPFMTDRGWKPLEELQHGDLIATAMRLPAHGVERPERTDLCRLLGYLAGDGSYLKHRSVSFISNDGAAFVDVVDIVSGNWPDVRARRKPHPEGYLEAEFSRTFENGWGRPHGNPLLEWLRELGIYGQTDETKRVAQWVFEAGRVGAAEFLAGYLDADGTVKFHKPWPRATIHFDTVSRGLAVDVQALLLRLGVISYIARPSWNTKSTVPIYRLILSEAEGNLQRFAALVPARGRRGQLLNAVLLESRMSTCPGLFALPRELSPHLASLGVGWRDQGKRMRRSTAVAYAARTGDSVLQTYAHSDVIWETIREIRPAGHDEVFDLRVPGAGNFIANGFVVHNSGAVEQDADVVMFLWRKERKPDPARTPVIELRVAKHRNGPTGDLRLEFEYEYTRFREIAAEAA